MKLPVELPSLVEIALEAGEYAQHEFLNFDRAAIEHKGKNDLVSYADKETEKLLVKNLRKLLPRAGFITEEGTVKAEEKEFRWVIDPIDGTTNFVHGIPLYAISVGLMHHEELVAGVVYNPPLKECFYASKGKGAFLNDDPLRVSAVKKLEDSLVITGFPYGKIKSQEQYLKLLGQFINDSQGFRRLGSAAIDLVYVAAGRSEAFFEGGLSAWDLAAGALIVKEAGGMVTDFKGGDNYIFGKELLAANPYVHKAVLELVQQYVD